MVRAQNTNGIRLTINNFNYEAARKLLLFQQPRFFIRILLRYRGNPCRLALRCSHPCGSGAKNSQASLIIFPFSFNYLTFRLPNSQKARAEAAATFKESTPVAIGILIVKSLCAIVFSLNPGPSEPRIIANLSTSAN